MIKHILLMKFNNDTSSRQLSVIREVFLSISDIIPGVLSVEWGVNNSQEDENAGFTHCVMMTFMDKSTKDEYLSYTEQFAFEKFFRPHLVDIIVFDYQFGRL
ncbi:TPA: Dabb family protein [Salmonella enterica subsp. enterica serovar Chester]|uniref:Dabb family protein n=2 Tax=Salmonella enterica I TaxID=59201 RepID=A0A5U3G729_SALET|nr:MULTISPECIES: Dabb family protein [Salmonella]EBD1320462.1 Dabb family protein [Salmonella enterica subsp. enterica serovar Choleraesuis]EBH9883897.1 Dabb family protein [Salmonella enterica subsp. enterica serovar Kisarawe]EBP4061223.1 Dabb family protein [Salmonella enterica subsp. enterica]ECF2428041.1 Dabb family protein [Salmonella enterica subsp. enterica serovar Beaudesert]ECY4197396.1 Dabb family protein [Salmonella enterica subsp. enterica serovar Ball]EDT5991803.1 Dabb family pro